MLLWAACAKQDTLTAVHWKIITCHQFAAIIICIMLLLYICIMVLLPDSVQIPVKTHLGLWAVTKPVVSQNVLIVKMNHWLIVLSISSHCAFLEMVLWELTLSSSTFLCWLYSFLLFPKVLLPAFHVMISLFLTHCCIVSMWYHTSFTALLWCLIGF